MASIVQRTAILGFARIAQRGLAFLSPIFMVRLLTVEQFGQYRDFLLYATMLFSMVEFCINSSLAYFVPKEPEHERIYFTQASLFVLGMSVVASLVVLLLGGYFPSEFIREYKIALGLYVLFLCNLDAWEVYWIAKKKTINVLYYSLSRLGLRTMIVIAAAYLSHRVDTVIWVLVCFEALRLLTMGGFAAKQGLFSSGISKASAHTQIAFFAPIGIANLLYIVDIYMGQVFVSAVLGPSALALYSIGAYVYPIIQVFRSSIGDVIMPEIVSRLTDTPKVALQLWQRTTVIYCAIMFPMAVLLFYYADVFVSTFFTSAYAAAVPIFQIFVLLLVRNCFDFGMPLRVVNRTKGFLYQGAFNLAVNFCLMLLLYQYFGILGPPLAMIITRFVASLVLVRMTIKYCDYTVSTMLPWAEIGKVTLLSLACIVIPYAGEALPIPPLVRAVLFGMAYGVVYVTVLTRFRIREINEFLARAWARTGLGATPQ